MKLSHDEDIFLRHWIYDEMHYQDGQGPAKRLQVEHKVAPADLATLVAAAMPNPAEQERVGLGPPPTEPPIWPWPVDAFANRLGEANSVLAAQNGIAGQLLRAKGILEGAADLARQVITPIICHNGQRESQHGMGTFLGIGDKKLLVTAAHVINEAIAAGYGMSVFDSIGTGSAVKGVPLSGQPVQIGESIDVAVIELSSDTVASLPNRRFLPLAYFSAEPIGPGLFTVFAYPTSGAQELPDRASRYMEPFAYGTVLYPGDTTLLENYNQKEHIAFLRESGEQVDVQGRPCALPSNLEGISGCPIWQVHSRGQSVEAWTSKRMNVVGVQTHVYKTAIRATRCWALGRILWEAYPSIRQLLELNGWTPDRLEKAIDRI